MGRPREHDDQTAAALLAAAERAIEADGVEVLSVRGVAHDVGTTTRAVYSLFGSKEGLVAALGAHAFDLLREDLERLEPSGDPVADLIECGLIFRRFATRHPSLFAIGVQRIAPAAQTPQVRAASAAALQVLKERIRELERAGGLGAGSVDEATVAFHALCEGLAALELRGVLRAKTAERRWRHGLRALVTGLASA